MTWGGGGLPAFSAAMAEFEEQRAIMPLGLGNAQQVSRFPTSTGFLYLVLEAGRMKFTKGGVAAVWSGTQRESKGLCGLRFLGLWKYHCQVAEILFYCPLS